MTVQLLLLLFFFKFCKAYHFNNIKMLSFNDLLISIYCFQYLTKSKIINVFLYYVTITTRSEYSTTLIKFEMLPSSEATPWLLQPHQGNMSRSWLRDTDSENGDALLCIYYINYRLHVKKKIE